MTDKSFNFILKIRIIKHDEVKYFIKRKKRNNEDLKFLEDIDWTILTKKQHLAFYIWGGGSCCGWKGMPQRGGMSFIMWALRTVRLLKAVRAWVWNHQVGDKEYWGGAWGIWHWRNEGIEGIGTLRLGAKDKGLWSWIHTVDFYYLDIAGTRRFLSRY